MKPARTIAVCLFLAAPAAAWEVPLELKAYRGQAGRRYVSGGIPLLEG